MQPPDPRDTKARLLDAAEAAFSEHGFQAASLRAITSAAEANLAAVNYHFGGKEKLFAAVFARRIEPINARRLKRLDALEADAAGAPIEVEALLAAFIEPACNAFAQLEDRGARFLKLSGRMFTEPGEHWTEVRAMFEGVLARFLAAFGQSLPHLAPSEVLWRLFFVVGNMCHTFSAGAVLTDFSRGACRGDDAGQSVPRLIGFLAAGMRSAEVRP